MTLIYMDASAIIKLFLEEPWAAEVEVAFTASDAHCITSDLSYAEIHGTFSRALALGRITQEQQKLLLHAFQAWFGQISHVSVTFQTIRRAGQLAINANLRGADAIHLNTAMEYVGLPCQEKRVFACFDRRLTEAAIGTGFFDGFVTDPAWLG